MTPEGTAADPRIDQHEAVVRNAREQATLLGRTRIKALALAAVLIGAMVFIDSWAWLPMYLVTLGAWGVAARMAWRMSVLERASDEAEYEISELKNSGDRFPPHLAPVLRGHWARRHLLQRRTNTAERIRDLTGWPLVFACLAPASHIGGLPGDVATAAAFVFMAFCTAMTIYVTMLYGHMQDVSLLVLDALRRERLRMGIPAEEDE